MRLLTLIDTWPWFGPYSSYSVLPEYLSREEISQRRVELSRTFFDRVLGRLYSICHGWFARRDSAFASAECRFRLLQKTERFDLSHILYFEHHLQLADFLSSENPAVATLHHPFPTGTARRELFVSKLKKLQHVILLYQRDIPEYQKILGEEQVHFCHHGVDTNFFFRRAQPLPDNHRVVFIGRNGRNFEMLVRVIERVLKVEAKVKFDLILNRDQHYPKILERIDGLSAVEWHQSLSSEALRNLYQNSSVMLLPMEHSGANSAVVEALASGLPVLTTDVGGIRDYGGGSVYPVVENNDDEAMVELLLRYIRQPEWRDEISKKSREFAESFLAWPVVARRHLEIYQSILR